GRVPRACRCRPLRGRHPPYRVRQVVGHDQRALRVHRYAHGAAARGAVAIAKARHEVYGRARRPAVLERYEHDLVAHGFAAIPAAMLTDENTVGELAAHGLVRKGDAQRGHVRAQRVVRLDRRGDFIGILRADAVVHILAPVAIGPAVEGAFLDGRKVVGHQVAADLVAFVHDRPQLARARLYGQCRGVARVRGLMRHMRARSASAVMPRPVMLLLDPMPTYRYCPSALAASALVQWWFISDGSGVTVSGGPLASVCPGW